LSLPESHNKGTNDLVSLESCKGGEEDVMVDSDGSEVLGETVPQPSIIVVCASRNCFFTGSFISNKVSHKLILLGSGAI
jgi:hypothetical protein